MKVTRMLGLALALTALSACGGSDDSGSTNTPTIGLNSALSGTWNGTTTVTFPGYQPFYYTSRLVLAVSGQNAVVSFVCPDGSGTVNATGTGTGASWQGTLTCPGVQLGQCSSVAVTYTSATALLNGSTLSVQGVGTATGCGTTSNVTVSFSGQK